MTIICPLRILSPPPPMSWLSQCPMDIIHRLVDIVHRVYGYTKSPPANGGWRDEFQSLYALVGYPLPPT